MPYKTLRKIVKTAGSPERLSPVSIPFVRAILKPLKTNTADIFVAGSKGVPTTNSYVLSVVASTIIQQEVTLEDDNLNALWIDATTSGEGVTVLAQTRGKRT